jgi:hypothetical protein
MQKCAEMMGSVDRDFSQHRSCENRTRSTSSAKYYRMSELASISGLRMKGLSSTKENLEK